MRLRPMIRDRRGKLPQHTFVEAGKTFRVDGCVIREVSDGEPALKLIRPSGDDELSRQAQSANARHLSEQDKPSRFNLWRFLGLL